MITKLNLIYMGVFILCRKQYISQEFLVAN